MNEERKEHLRLPFVGEFSLGPKYVCSVCGEKLRTEKSERTNWQEWYFTIDGRRHYKNRCNLKETGNKNGRRTKANIN